MLGSDVTTRVKWRCPHYFRRGIASEREGEGERIGKVPSIQNKMADVFFPSFVQLVHDYLFLCKLFLFLLLTDKTRTAVKVIYLLISVQFIFDHAL